MSTVKKLLKKYNDIPVPVKATIWFVFCSVIQKCISLITTPIFTRIMSTEQFGQFTVYNSWLQIFTIITTLRLNYAVFNKGMSKFKDDRDAYTSTMQTLTTILTVICFVIYLIFRRQINALTELPTFVMLAMFVELLLTPAIDFWTIRKRYEYIYKPIISRTLLMAFLNAGIGVVAVLLAQEKGIARIMSCVLVNVCFGIVFYTYNLIKGKKLFVKAYAKFALMFNLPLLLHYISQYVLDQFDRIMIQKMVGMSAAALYGVAYNAGLIMRIVTQSINNSLVPWQYEKLEKKQFKELDKNLFLILLLVGCCTLIFCVFAPEIMMVLADAKYMQAVYVIPPIALSTFFTFAYTSFANIEFFYDENKFTMWISLSGAALNIGLNYITISLFGFVSAAYTTLFCYVAFAVAHYVYMTHGVKRALNVDKVLSTPRYAALGAGVLAVGIAIIALYSFPLIRYALVAAALIMAVIKRKQIVLLLKSIKKK